MTESHKALANTLIAPDWPAPASVRACITTRGDLGSDTPWAGFNLALHVGDNEAEVLAHRDALSDALSLTQPPQWLEQVHGTRVVEAEADGLVRTADACVTSQAGLACVVMTADCLPILICNRDGTRVAAVHAGWRGLADGIIGRAIEAFEDAPSELLVYLGPAISGPVFEVGIEVLETFFEHARSTAHSERIASTGIGASVHYHSR